jgi:hypothetical protein
MYFMIFIVPQWFNIYYYTRLVQTVISANYERLWWFYVELWIYSFIVQPPLKIFLDPCMSSMAWSGYLRLVLSSHPMFFITQLWYSCVVPVKYQSRSHQWGWWGSSTPTVGSSMEPLLLEPLSFFKKKRGLRRWRKSKSYLGIEASSTVDSAYVV